MKVMDSAKLCQRYIIKELRLSIVGLVLRTLLTCLMQINLIRKEWREASLVSECTKWAELLQDQATPPGQLCQASPIHNLCLGACALLLSIAWNYPYGMFYDLEVTRRDLWNENFWRFMTIYRFNAKGRKHVRTQNMMPVSESLCSK